MNREQLAHVLRAASAIVPEGRMLIIGSQAVLGSFEEHRLPVEATASIEVDLAYFDDPDEDKADRVDGAIGELSLFHQTFGFYAQGVSISTAILPRGWQQRVVLWGEQPGSEAAFLEPHDCVLAKLLAFRQKDRSFAAALLHAGLLHLDTLQERLGELDPAVDDRRIDAVRKWLAQQRS